MITEINEVNIKELCNLFYTKYQSLFVNVPDILKKEFEITSNKNDSSLYVFLLQFADLNYHYSHFLSNDSKFNLSYLAYKFEKFCSDVRAIGFDFTGLFADDKLNKGSETEETKETSTLTDDKTVSETKNKEKSETIDVDKSQTVSNKEDITLTNDLTESRNLTKTNNLVESLNKTDEETDVLVETDEGTLGSTKTGKNDISKQYKKIEEDSPVNVEPPNIFDVSAPSKKENIEEDSAENKSETQSDNTTLKINKSDTREDTVNQTIKNTGDVKDDETKTNTGTITKNDTATFVTANKDKNTLEGSENETSNQTIKGNNTGNKNISNNKNNISNFDSYFTIFGNKIQYERLVEKHFTSLIEELIQIF